MCEARRKAPSFNESAQTKDRGGRHRELPNNLVYTKRQKDIYANSTHFQISGGFLITLFVQNSDVNALFVKCSMSLVNFEDSFRFHAVRQKVL